MVFSLVNFMSTRDWGLRWMIIKSNLEVDT